MSRLSENPDLEEIKKYLKECSNEIASQPENNDAPQVLTNYKKYIASLEDCLYKKMVTDIQKLADQAGNLAVFEEALKKNIAAWSFEYCESPLGIMQSPGSKVNVFYLELIAKVFNPTGFEKFLDIAMPHVTKCLTLDQMNDGGSYVLVEKAIASISEPTTFSFYTKEFLANYSIIDGAIIDNKIIREKAVGQYDVMSMSYKTPTNISLGDYANHLNWSDWVIKGEEQPKSENRSWFPNASAGEQCVDQVIKCEWGLTAKNAISSCDFHKLKEAGYVLKFSHWSNALDLLSNLKLESFDDFYKEFEIEFGASSTGSEKKFNALPEEKQQKILDWFDLAWQDSSRNFFGASGKKQLAEILLQSQDGRFFEQLEKKLSPDHMKQLCKEMFACLTEQGYAHQSKYSQNLFRRDSRFFSNIIKANADCIKEVFSTMLRWGGNRDAASIVAIALEEGIDSLKGLTYGDLKEAAKDIVDCQKYLSKSEQSETPNLISICKRILSPVDFMKLVQDDLIPYALQLADMNLIKNFLDSCFPEIFQDAKIAASMLISVFDEQSGWVALTRRTMVPSTYGPTLVSITNMANDRWEIMKKMFPSNENNLNLARKNLFDALCNKIHERTHDQREYFVPLECLSFFSKLGGGRSRSEKLSAIDKMLRHLVGMPDDNGQPITFTQDEIEILKQGTTGKLIADHMSHNKAEFTEEMLFPQSATENPLPIH